MRKIWNIVRPIARREAFLGVTITTALIFAFFGHDFFAHESNTWFLAFLFVWLLVVVMGSALSVVRHADHLAELLGEPFGTLILTLSVTTIELLSITTVMLSGENNPTLVRDTFFAVVMIVLGGMVGGSLLLGGWRHREQVYNLQGANAYLTCILPLGVMTLILPNFTLATRGPTLSLTQQIFLGCMSFGIYVIFLAIQTGRHRSFFVDVEPDEPLDAVKEPTKDKISIAAHVVLLIMYMVPVSFLAEQLAQPINYTIETLHAPVALGGLAIAIVVALPELMQAMRAAAANHLQRAVNISLGSVLSTVGLTIPIMLGISFFTGRVVHLGLEGANSILLMLILTVSVVTFSSGRTNILQGAVHFLLFAAFVLLIFEN